MEFEPRPVTHPQPSNTVLHRPRARGAARLGIPLTRTRPQRSSSPSPLCLGGSDRSGLGGEVRRQGGWCGDEPNGVHGQICDFLTSGRRQSSPQPPSRRYKPANHSPRPRVALRRPAPLRPLLTGLGRRQLSATLRLQPLLKDPPTKGACAVGSLPDPFTHAQNAGLLRGACVNLCSPSCLPPAPAPLVQVLAGPDPAT